MFAHAVTQPSSNLKSQICSEVVRSESKLRIVIILLKHPQHNNEIY